MTGESILDVMPFEAFVRESADIASKITPSHMYYHVEGALPGALIMSADTYICDRLDSLDVVVLGKDDKIIWTPGIRDSQDIRDYLMEQAQRGVVDFACFLDYENGRISNGLELNNNPYTFDRNHPEDRVKLNPVDLEHYLPSQYLANKGSPAGGKTRNALRAILAFDGIHSASALKQTVLGQYGVGTAIYIGKEGLEHLAYVDSSRAEMNDPTLPINSIIEERNGPATLFHRAFQRQNGVLVPVETRAIDTSSGDYFGINNLVGYKSA